jgi:hypothetical protein
MTPAARRQRLGGTTKVSTRDLMARMGHDDMRAALIYQRATQDAADRIADGLSELADRHRGTTGDTAAG